MGKWGCEINKKYGKLTVIDVFRKNNVTYAILRILQWILCVKTKILRKMQKTIDIHKKIEYC